MKIIQIICFENVKKWKELLCREIKQFQKKNILLSKNTTQIQESSQMKFMSFSTNQTTLQNKGIWFLQMQNICAFQLNLGKQLWFGRFIFYSDISAHLRPTLKQQVVDPRDAVNLNCPSLNSRWSQQSYRATSTLGLLINLLWQQQTTMCKDPCGVQWQPKKWNVPSLLPGQSVDPCGSEHSQGGINRHCQAFLEMVSLVSIVQVILTLDSGKADFQVVETWMQLLSKYPSYNINDMHCRSRPRAVMGGRLHRMREKDICKCMDKHRNVEGAHLEIIDTLENTACSCDYTQNYYHYCPDNASHSSIFAWFRHNTGSKLFRPSPISLSFQSV